MDAIIEKGWAAQSASMVIGLMTARIQLAGYPTLTLLTYTEIRNEYVKLFGSDGLSDFITDQLEQR